MINIVSEANKEIKKFQEIAPPKTGDFRKISAKLYKSISDKSAENVLSLSTDLLDEHSWGMGVIAFDLAYRARKSYSYATYDVFYGWLKKYVGGWGDCDDFCTHAFGELLRQRKELFSNILSWTDDEDFWVRRASAVILIPAILHNDYEGINPLVISDKLMNDKHYLVLKGYGWMLKSLSQVNPTLVKEYLVYNHSVMPRVSYRYALQKFDKKTRDELMHL